MSIKQITSNLIQITKFGVMNCYLVKEDDGLTVIDAGMAGMEKMIIEAAEEQSCGQRQRVEGVDDADAIDHVKDRLGAQS